MKTIRLGNIATVELSNVNKKSKEGEKAVRLCNFVDVYKYWAITAQLSKDFLVATANNNQIEKYSIHKGQVAMTKDSETRDDIGISAYIADDIDDCVLGYHCALITPSDVELDGSYLNALLHTDYAKKYFGDHASGSGQRFTLSKGIIEDFPVILPDSITEQQNIARILSMIDRKITLNNSIYADIEEITRMIYDYWFVQFDFPNTNGSPYKSNGGKMIWNNKINRLVPESWTVGCLGDFAFFVNERIDSSTLSASNYVGVDNLLPNMKGRTLSDYVPANGNCVRFIPCDILLGNIRPYFKKIWFTNISGGCSADVLSLRCNDINCSAFIYATLARDDFFKYDTQGAKGSKMPRGDKNHIMNYPIAFSYEYIKAFDLLVHPLYDKMNSIFAENLELNQLRDYILPVLLNGQITIDK